MYMLSCPAPSSKLCPYFPLHGGQFPCLAQRSLSCLAVSLFFFLAEEPIVDYDQEYAPQYDLHGVSVLEFEVMPGTERHTLLRDWGLLLFLSKPINSRFLYFLKPMKLIFTDIYQLI